MTFVKKLAPGTWLHFHCRGGKGRSTTFMVLYDILRNGKHVSLDDIVKRQQLLGGSILLEISEKKAAEWKRDAAIERKRFIEQFYEYATSDKGYPQKSWTEWCEMLSESKASSLS